MAAESRARMEIDRQLHACGWVVQDRSAMNLYASQGVAVREFIVVVDPEEGCQLMVEVGDRIRLSSMKGRAARASSPR